MARRKSNFIIGLFVTVGIAIGVAAIVWVGASQYFEKGSFYATYFDESVQGLQVDSRVKYRGVEIGKVESIGVAPDRRLVEVIMKIDLPGEDVKNVVTQLRAAGITGIVFIELDRRVEETAVLTPPEGMETHYPVIASRTSQSKQILMGVDQIINKIDMMDLDGIADQVKKTLQTAETFLGGREMKAIVGKIDSTVGSLDQGLQKIDRILAQGKVEGVLEEARQGLKESREAIGDVRKFIASLDDQVKNLRAGETIEKTGKLIDGLDRRTRRMAADFGRTTDDIRQAVESLNLLLDRLHASPSDLIFSRPALEDDGRGEGRR